MSKQISSIEWLVNVLNTKYGGNDFIITHASEIEQAKAMHKEEQENTWINSRIEDKGDDYIGKQKTFEEYYNDTFA